MNDPAFGRWALRMLAATLLAATPAAMAADITWNGTSSGGTWDTTNTNWNTAVSAPWNSGNGSSNIAVFDTSSLTLNVGSVFANGITFTQSATLSGGNITLSGLTPTISGEGSIGSVLLGTAGFTKSGVGTLTLTGTNLYTGGTRITGGTVAITSDANLGAAPGTATASSIVLDNGILSTAGTFTLNANRGIAVGPTSGSGNGTINVASGELTYNGIIASNGASSTGSLVKTGTGTLTLGGVNTYTGNTDIAAGTLKLANASAIPSGTGKGDVTVAGTLDLNANSITLNGLSGAGLITSSAAGSITLTAGANNRTSTFTGTIANGSGTLALTKTGTGTLTLGGSNTFTGGVTINGGALQLANAGAFNSSTPNTLTFGPGAAVGTKLQLNGYSVTIGALATNATPGTVVIENANASDATLTVSQTTNTTFAGAFQNGTGGGALSLTKNGTGTLTLTGANSHTGTTTINAGTLALGGSAIADTGAVVLANVAGATLQLNAAETIGSLAGGGASGGNVTLQSFTLTTGGANTDTTYSGVISGTGSLVKTGTGAMTLGRANTFTGTTTIKNGQILLGIDNALATGTVLTLGDGTTNTSGVLRLNAFNQTLAGLTTAGTGTANRIVNGSATVKTLTINNATNSAFSGILGGPGTDENNFNLVKTGTGTLTLSGNNTFSGTTTINDGTISAGNLTTALGSGSSAVNFGGGTLSYTGGNATFSRGFAVNASGGRLDTTTAGQTLTLATTGVTITGVGTFTVGGAGNTAITAAISGASGILTKTGTGTLTLSGANTYAGVTNIKAGTLALGADNAVNQAATVTLGDSSNTNGVLRLSGFSQTVSRLSTVGSGTGNRITGGNATLSNLTINNPGSSSFAGILGGTGPNDNNLALTKTGAGVLTLSGTNTYTGGTTISAGTLAVGAATGLGATSGNLSIGNATLQITADLSSARNIALNDASSSILVDSARTYTNSGAISGTGALNLTGNGTLLISGASNNFSGGTNIRNGTLTLGIANALPTGTTVTLGNSTTNTSGRLALNGFSQTVVGLATSGTGTANRIVNGRSTAATLTVSNASDIAFNGILGGTTANENNFALTKTGAGKLTINGTNTYTGNTTVSAGTLAIASATAIPSGAGNGSVQVNGTLDVNGFSPAINGLSGTGFVLNNGAIGRTIFVGNNNITSTFNGTIQDGTGTLALTKNGTGTLTLGGANTYSGNTTVTTGTLKVANATAIPFGTGKGNVSLAGALDLNGYSITLNGLSGAGSVNSTVSGAATLSVGANDQTSGFTGVISNGTGTVSLNKVGTGTLTLGGASTYTGATVVKNGTLALSAGNDRLPTGTILTLGDGVTNDSGVFQLNRRNQTVAGIITAGTGTGNRVINGDATLATFTVNNTSGTNTFSGILGGPGTNENNFTLAKSGAGTLLLTGNNTFTGNVTINSTGVLQVGHVGALNASGVNTVTFAQSATSATKLQLNGYSVTIAGLVTNATTAGSPIVENANATNATLTINNTGNFVYASAINDGTGGGTLSLIKSGSGTQTLNGTSSYTGGTTISGGILSINGDSALGATSGNLSLGNATLQVTGNITASPRNVGLTDASSTILVNAGRTYTNNSVISGTGTLNKDGTGIFQITGNKTNTYNGGTIVKSGLLDIVSVSGTSFGEDVSTNNIAVNPGANLSLSSTANKGANQTITVTSNATALGGIGFSNTSLTQAQLSGMFADSTDAYGGVLSINNGISYGTALNLSTFGNSTLSGYGKWFLGSAATGTYSASTLTVGADSLYRLGGGGGALAISASNVLTGNNSVQVGFAGTNGQGTVTISANQNYNGTTSILGGTLSIGADARLGTAPSSPTAGSIVINGGTLQGTRNFPLNSNRGIALGPTSGSGTGTFDVTSGNTVTYDGIIANNGSGTGSFVKSGAGTLSLNGTNTFTGSTSINNGVLIFYRMANLGAGSAINFGGGTLRYATGNTDDITTRTVVTNLTNGATIDTNGNDVTFASSGISGSGPFTKTGLGTLSLNATNSYTGATIITQGTVKLGIVTAIPNATAARTTTVNGTLDLNGFSPTVNLLRGNGTVTNSNATAASLTVNTGGSTSAGTFSGNITDGAGTVAFVKAGANTLNLTSNASTYSGGTTISAGTLAISNDRALGVAPGSSSPANITIVSGAILSATTNSFALDSNRGILIDGNTAATISVATGLTLTYNGTISNNGSTTGGLTKADTTGTLVLGGANTYAGNTTISGGTLRITNSSAIPSGSGKGNVSIASNNSGNLDLNGNTITINGLSGAGGITSSVSGAAGISIGGNDQTSAYSGNITNGSGVVSVAKIGTGTLTLSGTSTYSGGTTISAGTLSISADANLGAAPGNATVGNIVINGGNLTTSANMTLNANRGIAVGPTSGSGNGTINPAAGTTLTYNGTIADNGGTGGLTKSNTTGTLVLGGANSFSGDTSILGGTLQLANVAAIPSGTGKGNVSLAAGSALDLNNLSPTVNGLTGSGNVTNSATGSATLTAGGNDATSSFGGIIQDGNGQVALAKTGTGTLTLTASNLYSGNTTISAGTLQLGIATALASGTGKGNLSVGAAGTLDLNGFSSTLNGISGAGNITNSNSTAAVLTAGANDQTSNFAGNITNGTGTLGLSKTGTGTLTLSGNNTYSGATTISTGTLALGSATGLSSNSTVTLSGPGFLDVNAFNATMDGLLGTGTILNNGATGATLTVGAAGGSTTFGGVIADGTSAISLTKSGSGTLTLTGVNTYTGTTTIADGTISAANVGAGGNLGSGSAPIVLGGASTEGTLSYTGASDLVYERGFVVNAGGGQMDITTAGRTLTLQTGGITANGTFTVGGAGSVNVASSISGPGGFTKANTGLTVLSGTNTYAGDTTISTGTLQVTNAAALPSGTGKGNVVIAAAAILDVANLSLTLNGLSGSGTVTNSQGSPVTLTVGDNNASGNFTGIIEDGTGTMSLTKIGTGMITLGGANTYSGDTTITEGTLQYGAANAIPSGTGKGNISLAAEGILDLNDFEATINGLSGTGLVTNNAGASTLTVGGNNQSSTFSGTMQDGTGTLGLTKTGSGTLTLSGNSTFSGATLISQGTVSMGSATGLSAASTLTIDNAGALDLNGRAIAIDGLAGDGSITNNNATPVTLTIGSSGGSGTFGGTIDDGTGVIGIVKSGNGTVTLTHANSYSGGTTVTGGLLGITSVGALGAIPATPTPGNIVLNGGGISAVNTFEINANRGIAVGPASGSGSGVLNAAENQTLTYNGIIANNGSGTGGLTTSGLGTVTLGGNNTYTGDTTVASGSLQVAGVNAIPFGTGKGNLVLNSTLDLNNTSITINGLSGNGTVGNTKSGSATFTVGANDQTSTFGGLIEDGNGQVGLTKTGTGTLTLTGINTYSGTTTIDAGTLAISGDRALGSIPGAAVADRIVIGTGGVLSALETFTLDSNRGILVGAPGSGAIDVVADKTLTYGGVIGNNGASGGFTKTGTGILILTGNSTYTGATTVEGGTLTVLGSLAGSTSLSVLTGATLTGTGTTGSMEVQSDGTLSPGDGGIGTLTVSGLLTLDGISNFELGTPGASHYTPGISDRVNVTGNVTYGGTINLIDNNNAGGLGSAGAGSYLLISYTGTASGNFTGVTGLPEYHNALHDVPADKALYIDLYNYAVAAITPSVDLGRIHAGGTFGTEILTVSNTAPAGNFTESLTGNFTSIPAGFTANGSVTEIAGGSSNTSSMVVGISDNTAGLKNGTVSLSFTSVAVPASGLGNTALSSQNATITGFAYTGQSTWISSTGGSWGNNSNNYAMWDAAGGSPGLDGALSVNDTATFGSAIAANATIALDGANPSLKSVTFNSTNSYTLEQGSGGTLTLAGNGGAATVNVQSGSHQINAPVALSTAANIVIERATDTLTIGSGGFSGTGSLALSGNGTLRVTGNNTYSGGTTVQNAVLSLASTGSIIGNSVIQGGGTITGTGSAGSLVIEASAFLDPGERVGTLYATTAELIAGGTYNVDISAANGLLSADADRLAVSGTLDLSGLNASNKFRLDLFSRPGGGSIGDLSGFEPGTEYSWIIGTFADLTLTGGVSRNSLTSLFEIDPTEFQSGTTTSGQWRVYATGTSGAGSLVLEIIPEPTTAALLAAGLGFLAAARLRRSRRR